MDQWKGKISIVTGAGNGIGADIAEVLVKNGLIVIGFELNEEEVNKIKKKITKYKKYSGKLVPMKCDVSKEEDISNAFELIEKKYNGLHLLINNAAIGRNALISTGDIKDFKDIIDVNIYGLFICTRFAVDLMKKKKISGQIINVNSISGHYMPPFPEPKINIYTTSKRVMTSFNTLLKNELALDNIRVTSISPSVVKTDLFIKNKIDFLGEDFFKNNSHLTTRDVSDIVVMILTAPKNIKITEIIFLALHELY